MLRFLQTHLRAKLMVLVVLPLAAGAALTALWIYRQNQVVVGLAPLTASSRLSARMGDLLHALQAERAATALYQGVHGRAMASEIRLRRQETDQALQAFELERQASGLPLLGDAPALGSERLKALRVSVEGARTAPDILDDYTRLTGDLLDLQDRLVQPAEGTPLESRFHARAALMHHLEQAELERAVLAHAFATQAFTGDLREHFVALSAAQEAEAKAFLRVAPLDWRKPFTSALQGPSLPDYDRLRLLATTPTTKLPDVDPFVWFRIATERIEALRRAEAGFATALTAQAEGMENSARRTRLILAMGSLLFGALVLTWTHVTGEKVLRPIQALEGAFARLRKGDLSVRLKVEGADETARMTEAFNVTCAQLGLMTRLLQEAAQRVAREAQGLSGSADRVGESTTQLARSTLVQREAAEQVAAAMLQLSASVEDLEDTLRAVRLEGRRAVDLAREAQRLGEEARVRVEGIRSRSDQAREASAVITELGRRLTLALQNVPSEPIRLALERTIQASESAADLARQNGEAVDVGCSHLVDLAAALAENLKALASMDLLAHGIAQVAQDQVAASREVSRRMQDTSRGTGEVQLAAAQLANTVPEVHHAAQELAGVALGMASTAETFTLS